MYCCLIQLSWNYYASSSSDFFSASLSPTFRRATTQAIIMPMTIRMQAMPRNQQGIQLQEGFRVHLGDRCVYVSCWIHCLIRQKLPLAPPCVLPEEDVCVEEPPELLSDFSCRATRRYRNISFCSVSFRLPSFTYSFAAALACTVYS